MEGLVAMQKKQRFGPDLRLMEACQPPLHADHCLTQPITGYMCSLTVSHRNCQPLFTWGPRLC